MVSAYAGVCGISADELIGNFKPELEALAQAKGMSYKEALGEMQKRYNGYHFAKGPWSQDSGGVFNPFGVLNTLMNQDFANYWFQTGTPTFLVTSLKRIDFDICQLTEGITIPADSIDDYRAGGNNLIPLLYQSGYLTIKDYDPQLNEYTLAFPNEEVEYGFLNELLPLYAPPPPDEQGFFVSKFFKDLRSGDVDAFMTRLRSFFASIPYELNGKTEKHYQTIFYLVFTLLGQYTQAEVRSAGGRADLAVTTKDAVYLFEFKLADKDSDELVDAALKQIDEKGYLVPYSAGGKQLVKIGAVFNTASRTLGKWKALTGSF
jgi:hypothetical protein